jgi:hypothetical protein
MLQTIFEFFGTKTKPITPFIIRQLFMDFIYNTENQPINKEFN